MKKIEEYLAYYLGCDCIVTCNGDFSEGWEPEKLTTTILTSFEQKTFTAIKPILRPLEDISSEERMERGKAIIGNKQFIDAEYHRWMLSKGFDLFGLIESGLALDKTKMK